MAQVGYIKSQEFNSETGEITITAVIDPDSKEKSTSGKTFHTLNQMVTLPNGMRGRINLYRKNDEYEG